MNLKINKNLRVVLIGLISIFIGITIFQLVATVREGGVEEKTIPQYQYTNTSNINYQVFLKPNIIYSEGSLGEDLMYVSEYVDHINLNFSYGFKGETTADIKGNYEVVGEIVGYTGQDPDTITIWQKNFPILPQKVFSQKGTDFNTEENIRIDLAKYNNLVKQIIDETKVLADAKLNIYMKVNLNTVTDEGVIEKTVSPAATIPLNVGYFPILKSGVGEETGTLDKTITVPLPANRKMINSYGVLTFLLLMSLLYLIFLVKPKTKENPLTIEVNRIFRDHGKRLVALENPFVDEKENSCRVHSIEDLVKIADELEKPIMYHYSQQLEEIRKFFIVDKLLYLLDLSNLVEEEEVVEVAE